MRILLAALLLAFYTLTASAATINVNNVGGCTLHDAIRAANANAARGSCAAGSGTDTIVLPDDFLLNTNSAIETISSPMTIRTATEGGLAGILNQSDRVLRVNNTANVELRNLVLDGGTPGSLSDSGGPGLLVESSTVSLFNVQIVGNHVAAESNRRGGGIKATNSTINLDGCFFSHNEARTSIAVDGRGGTCTWKTVQQILLIPCLRGTHLKTLVMFT